MTWTTNWFACSECGEPTKYLRKGEDGYYYGKCRRCKSTVKLIVDYDGRQRNEAWPTETTNSKNQ